jgi:hypothetical protein
MRGKREQRQLKLIEEFVSVAETAGAACWLRGGWAVDFLVGRVTRAHEDLDLFIWAADAPMLLPILDRHGFQEVGGPPPAMQRNIVKDGEELHVTLLERNEIGVVTAGGRWADAPWPAGMLDGPIGRVGHIRCRVISPEAQLYAKGRTRSRCRRRRMIMRSRQSPRTVRTQRSAKAFAFGARTGVRITSIPSERKTPRRFG